jgi:diguanylate cyclase (GGDEF)-like protein
MVISICNALTHSRSWPFLTKTLGRSTILFFSAIMLVMASCATYAFYVFTEQRSIATLKRDREQQTALLTADLVGLQKQIAIDVIEVQQFLTGFAATRGQDGHDDGFRNAKEFADRLALDIDAAKTAANKLESPQIAAAFAEIQRRFPQYYELGQEMAKTYAVQGTRAGNTIMDRFDAMTEELRTRIAATKTTLDAVMDRNEALITGANAKIDRLSAYGNAVASISILLIVLACLFGIYLSRCLVVQPLTWITLILKRLSHGDIDWGTYEVSRMDEIGDLARVYAEFRHITIERTEAQRKVVEQQASVEAEQRQTNLLAERFDAALRNMMFGLVMLDRDRRVLVANPRMAGLLGVPADETMIGLRIEELMRRSADVGCLSETNFKQLLIVFGGRSACHETFACGQPVCPYFERRFACHEKRELLIETRLERVLEFSFQPMENEGYLMLVEDITEKRSAESAVRRLAYFDPLTELPNRRSFFESVERALTEATPARETFALLFVDLDYFKQVNDTMGHGAGDELLRGVARRLTSIVREEDVVARLGGDEFVILQRDVRRLKEIMALAERIIECCRAPFLLAGQQVRVGASVGIARSPRNGEDRETLLRNADTALYRAKASGRNGWRFFKPAMHAELVARAALERDLRRAVAEKTLKVYFQPILHTDGEKISAFEALLRWRHPERGMVSPVEFIPIAEETGLIVEMGAHVLERACRACATWPEDIRVAVNLSALQFKKGDLVVTIEKALSTSGLAPNRLEVEITESVLMQDTESVCGVLRKLRDLGVSISLDDFGTGYSSLSYLHRFPLDRVKIDRSFLRKACNNQNSLTLLHGIIRLGVELGLGLIVEGVETLDQLHLVRGECAMAEVQGFLFSQAVPTTEVPKLLARIHIQEAA